MEFKFSLDQISEHKAEALVMGLFESAHELPTWGNSITQTTVNYIAKQLKDRKFKAKEKTSFVFSPPPQLPVKHLIIVGLGDESNFSPVIIRQAAAAAAAKCLELNITNLATPIMGIETLSKSSTVSQSVAIQAMTEGFMLGSYRFNRYLTDRLNDTELSQVTFLTKQLLPELETSVAKGEAIATSILNARDIVNEPPSKIKPIHLVKASEEIASLSRHISVTVLDEAKLKKANYSALLAVASGSEEKPYLIHLHYKPVKFSTRLALVGKGVTFDSGGLGIKPWGSMRHMKIDMAGAATVLGIFQAVAELESINQPIDCELHGIIAATENMISGKAMRPDDIIETRSGKTIEIIHTDAEGRLILSDALTYATELNPDFILDFATLTGSAINAVGQSLSAFMGNNRKLLDMVKQASQESGELAWELPLPAIYRDKLKSQVADLQNIDSGSSSPGAIFGGLFLQEFVNQIPWVHFDIAGPAFQEELNNPVYPKGATGYGILLGMNLIESLLRKIN